MTDHTLVPHRPGARSWLALVAAELRAVIRDTGGLVIPLGLPLLILVTSGSGTSDEVLPGMGGLTALDVYVLPIVLTMVMATIGVINLPSFLAYYRKAGILRRLAVTPVHPSMVLVAQVATSLLQTLVGVALAVAVAFAAFDAHVPRAPLLALASFFLAALAMYAVGLLIASVAPSANAATAIGLVTFFAIGAAGGMFGGADNLPEPVERIGEVLPFGAAVRVMSTAWTGATPDLLHVGSLVVTIVVSGIVAARLFRWESAS